MNLHCAPYDALKMEDSYHSNEVYSHGMALNPQSNRVQCNYCGKVVSGFDQLQHHLVGIGEQTAVCRFAPPHVKRQFRGNLNETSAENIMNEVGELFNTGSPSNRKGLKRGKVESAQSVSPMNANRGLRTMESAVNHNDQSSSKRRSPNTEAHESLPMSAKRWVGRFFFENDIDPGSVESPSFRKMMEISANARDIKSCIPTPEELEGWILSDEQKEVQNYVEEIKASWTRTGCSILLDGWVNNKGRNLLNIVVDCPLGTIYLRSFDISNLVEDVDGMVLLLEDVIAEVGAQNIVQIISYTTSHCMNAVGERLIGKYRSLFWTVSATYCMSVMLEKIETIDSVKQILDKAKTITRFIYSHEAVLGLMRRHIGSFDLLKSSNIKAAMPFLTLENILMEKKNLGKMVSSSAWLKSPWASKAEARRVANLVVDKSFWAGLTLVVRATIPLVRVLFLINGDGKPHLGFIYETLDQVKETICEELGEKKSQYMPFWNIIDEVWNEVLHSPLHAAGYFLNPSFHYSEDFCADPEVTGGLLIAVVRMVEDLCSQDLVTQQLDAYRACKGAFKKGTENKKHEIIPPAAWWSTFGSHCPDLQKLAIRILSQTCNGAESYGLKREMAEKLLSSGKNPAEFQKLSNLSYVHYNMQLKQCKMSAKFNVHAKESDLMVDWIMDRVHYLRDIKPQKDDLAWMNLQSSGPSVSENLGVEKGPTRVQPKVQQ